MLFSLVVKLLQYQKINDIRHVMIPGKCGNEKVVKYMWSQSFITLNIQVLLMLTLRRKTHWSFSLRLGPRMPLLGSRG